MFTGIIEAIGKVREPEKLGDGVRLTIDTPAGWLKGTEIGESIAVNGACMTVVNIEGDTFQIEVSAESLSKTCGLDTWGEVNLEKALRVGDRLERSYCFRSCGRCGPGGSDGTQGRKLAFSGSCPHEIVCLFGL